MLHWRGNGVDEEALRDRIPLRQIAGKGPRWDLMGTEGCGGGKVVSWLPWMFSGYTSIYRRKKYVDGATRVPRGLGACLPPGRALLPRGISDFNSKSSCLLSVQERSSRRFHSVWTPFDIAFLRNTEIGKNSNMGWAPG